MREGDGRGRGTGAGGGSVQKAFLLKKFGQKLPIKYITSYFMHVFVLFFQIMFKTKNKK